MGCRCGSLSRKDSEPLGEEDFWVVLLLDHLELRVVAPKDLLGPIVVDQGVVSDYMTKGKQ